MTEDSSSEEYLSADEGNEENSPDKSMRCRNISGLCGVAVPILLDPALTLCPHLITSRSLEPTKDAPSQLSPSPPEEHFHHVENNPQSGVLSEEERTPVPPPRTKRKKRQMNKPPSMENLLIEVCQHYVV